VPAISLTAILNRIEYAVDLIDMDIQGQELVVLEAAKNVLQRKVRRVHIGTHSTEIEDGLRDLFLSLEWQCVHDYGIGATRETPFGEIDFQDGVQGWINPRDLDEADH